MISSQVFDLFFNETVWIGMLLATTSMLLSNLLLGPTLSIRGIYILLVKELTGLLMLHSCKACDSEVRIGQLPP
jgi:hypothetical protein